PAGGAFVPAVADSAILTQAASQVRRQAEPLDVNSATADELQTLAGIGPVLAERIVAERDRGGPFDDGDDLARRVQGIGPATVSALAGRITFASDSAQGENER
ncbi:MAG TPA: helix-hairpin-helix domain-containing protein, partial [Candidatus Glassbacteria bacterium]|nr:helix-hairpin-helix domain-containing protein [Candidatus Glassbacteria bacterium]